MIIKEIPCCVCGEAMMPKQHIVTMGKTFLLHKTCINRVVSNGRVIVYQRIYYSKFLKSLNKWIEEKLNGKTRADQGSDSMGDC